jgi:hypothetical protein
MAKFKILGVRINHQDVTSWDDFKKSRYLNILKVLSDNGEKDYLFYDNIDINDNGKENFQISEKIKPLSDNFFFTPNNGALKNVEVCAIVGKNGTGKSSIIDLIIRLINNFACFCLTEYGEDRPISHRLHFVPDIYASLYFEIDGEYYKLEQTDSSVGLYKENEVLFNSERNNYIDEADSNAFKELSEHFFYTIVFNYSLYSYNFYDYEPEWDNTTDEDYPQEFQEEIDQQESEDAKNCRKCWLTGLFHKNDGYQTPVVINPYREDGKIKAQNENKLAKERLLYLVLLRNENKEPFFRKVIDDKEAYQINLDINLKYDSVPNHHVTGPLTWLFGPGFQDSVYDNFYNQIIDGWSRCFNINFNNVSLTDETDKKRALNYLVYKTIKVTKNYVEYKEFFNIFKKGIFLTDDQLKEMILRLYKDRSHKTLKIRQTLSLLLFNHLNSSMKYKIDTYSEILESYIENNCQKQKGILAGLHTTNPYSFHYEFEETLYFEFEDFVPTPAFNVHIYLKSSKNDIPIEIDKISSGERQLIYSFSSLLYHLRNIDSVFEKEGDQIKYKYVSVFIDEVELYYHPEYQRKFVKFILNWLSNIRLKHIEGIQLCFSTHSPFVLSDIPKNNILFLKNSDDREIKGEMKETFGANIYDLLHNNFFLKEHSMGDFAYWKIQELIQRINLLNSSISEKELCNYESEINIIGDPFLKEQLNKLFHRKIGDFESFKLSELKRKKEELENEIKKIENDTNS